MVYDAQRQMLYYYVFYVWYVQRSKYINNINKCKKEENIHQLLFIIKGLITSIIPTKSLTRN